MCAAEHATSVARPLSRAVSEESGITVARASSIAVSSDRSTYVEGNKRTSEQIRKDARAHRAGLDSRRRSVQEARVIQTFAPDCTIITSMQTIQA